MGEIINLPCMREVEELPRTFGGALIDFLHKPLIIGSNAKSLKVFKQRKQYCEVLCKLFETA